MEKRDSAVKRDDGAEFCLVRTYAAGVFAGWVHRDAVKNQSVTVYRARRLWYWEGAASISQLATDGPALPENCKFPCAVEEVDVFQVAEIIPCTEKAMEAIDSVKVWSYE